MIDGNLAIGAEAHVFRQRAENVCEILRRARARQQRRKDQQKGRDQNRTAAALGAA